MERQAEASIKGLDHLYRGLVGHQLAMFHGTTREIGHKLWNGEATSIPADLIFRDRIGIGGFRSGKTRSAVLKAWNDALLYPDNEIVVVRKRHEQMRNTFLKDFKNMGEEISDGHLDWLILDESAGDGAVEMMILTNGKPTKIIFRIEPDGDDEFVRDSFKGYESGLWIFEEFSQLKKITYDTGRSRLSKRITLDGRESSPLMPGWRPASLALSNPAFDGHWVTELARSAESDLLTGMKPLEVVIRSSMEDNPALTKEYIENEKRKYKNDPIGYDMYINGLDGIKTEGRPVFVNHFNHDLHVNPDIRYNPQWPIIRGLDWGYNFPACVWIQGDDQGRFNILAEFQGREMEAKDFAQVVLDKSKLWFPLATRFRDWGDPSGFFQTDKGITANVVNSVGLHVRPAGPNNDPDRRIGIMRRLFSKIIGGRSRLQLHPRCNQLELAFRHGYHYAINSRGEVANTPRKNNKYDNIVDACAYAIEGENRGIGEETNMPYGGGGETIALGMDRLDAGLVGPRE